jgi:NMD protein affecting ribosome stability and mRNA decay
MERYTKKFNESQDNVKLIANAIHQLVEKHGKIDDAGFIKEFSFAVKLGLVDYATGDKKQAEDAAKRVLPKIFSYIKERI